MACIYTTQVVEVGPEAEIFRAEDMFILFGSEAPDNLRSYCYIIDRVDVGGNIEPGQKLVIDGREYTITAVGSVAPQNLQSLGHISVVFNGATSADLDGTIYVEPLEIPLMTVGSEIAIQG